MIATWRDFVNTESWSREPETVNVVAEKIKAEFEKAGGRFLLGDTVTDAAFDENGNVTSVGTVNFGDIRVYADNFVLATGSFFSKGLVATLDNVIEPVFGVDITFAEGRDKWFDRNFWKKQNYISKKNIFSQN